LLEACEPIALRRRLQAACQTEINAQPVNVICAPDEGRVDGEQVAMFGEDTGERVQIFMPYFWRPCKKFCHSFQGNS